jgi:hypothetical protein
MDKLYCYNCNRCVLSNYNGSYDLYNICNKQEHILCDYCLNLNGNNCSKCNNIRCDIDLYGKFYDHNIHNNKYGCNHEIKYYYFCSVCNDYKPFLCIHMCGNGWKTTIMYKCPLCTKPPPHIYMKIFKKPIKKIITPKTKASKYANVHFTFDH